ncbi:MAG: hypothetical protein P8I55_02080 [Crocinitomix sp.]|nr:hypothetical protein [Crocinitomix sp.]
MFGFFKKKKKVAAIDKVYRTIREKVDAIGFDVEAFLAAGEDVFIFYYFEETKKWVEYLLNAKQIEFTDLGKANRATKATLFPAKDINPSSRLIDSLRRYSDANSSQFLFANRYPLYTKEVNILEDLSTLHDEVIQPCFYLSLNDPLMEVFGSDRIKVIMDRMGYKEGELIQHAMVTKSISIAQQKLEGNVDHENRADSQEECFERNLPEGA